MRHTHTREREVGMGGSMCCIEKNMNFWRQALPKAVLLGNLNSISPLATSLQSLCYYDTVEPPIKDTIQKISTNNKLSHPE